MKNILLTSLLFSFSFCYSVAQNNCDFEEDFDNYSHGDFISEESNDWDIINPPFYYDGIVLSDYSPNGLVLYVAPETSGELSHPQTGIEYDIGGNHKETFCFSLDLLKEINFIQGEVYFEIWFTNGELLQFYCSQSGSLDITYVSNNGNEYYSGFHGNTDEWTTFLFDFNEYYIYFHLYNDLIYTFDATEGLNIDHVEFYGGSYGYLVDNICLTEKIIFSCDDAWELECNDDGDDYIVDSNNPNSNTFSATDATDILTDHSDCNGEDDGCDGNNDNGGNNNNAGEVLYKARANTNGNMVVDMHWGSSSDNLQLFAYEECVVENGPIYCASSSTYSGTSFESLIIENVSSFDEYFIVVDGQQNNDQSNFAISLTCGDLDDHDKDPIFCGIPIMGDTRDSENKNSFYCGCQFQSRNDGRQNYGPEDVYEFEFNGEGPISITLEILDDDIDLNLYLLDECDVMECDRASDSDTPGEAEQIDFSGTSSNMLKAGTYFIVVEGFRGDAGEYILTLEHDACKDPCENSMAANCERFESYATDSNVTDYDNWELGTFGSIPCKVKEDGGNKYLAVDQENFQVCAANFDIPESNSEWNQLQFDLYLPYAEGFSFWINESDPEDLAFFNFSDYMGGGTSFINYSVNDVAYSENFAYEAFDYPYDEWFGVHITLDEAKDLLSVFVNDQLLFSTSGTGIEKLEEISFDANLTNQSGNGFAARVDNICLNLCGEMPFTDPCDYLNEIECEIFDDYAEGSEVNKQNNWSDSFLSGALFVDEEDNGNRYMAVEDEGNQEAGARYIIAQNANADEVEVLSYRSLIPTNGGLSTFYEASNGQSMFLDIIHSSNYGAQVNFGIEGVFYSMSPSGDSYVDAPFNADEWFDIQFNLDRSTQNMNVFINGDLLFSVANSGFDAFEIVEFLSVLSNNKTSRVDDLCLSQCGECVEPYVDAQSCNGNVVIVSTENTNGPEYKMNLRASSIIDVVCWEVVNLNSGEVEKINTTEKEISIFVLPYINYEICVYYKDNNGCLVRCCLDWTTSTGETDQLDVEVYPNPVSDRLIIKAEREIDAMVLQSLDGKIIFSKAINKTTTELNVSALNLNAGVYLLKLSSETRASLKKIVLID